MIKGETSLLHAFWFGWADQYNSINWNNQCDKPGKSSKIKGHKKSSKTASKILVNFWDLTRFKACSVRNFENF